MKHSDVYWMQRCLTLAKKGSGHVSPNPLVGAVIVKEGRLLAEGYHQQYGGPHAEINAINYALSKNKNLIGATIYINLEPCFHFGKTPPCVHQIIANGFSKVVIATLDPNPLVAGKSIKYLKLKGVSCSIGVCKRDAEKLNEHFFKFIRTSQPFVAVKAAQTSDGFIGRLDGKQRWISNKRSRSFGHKLRNEYDAILVGAQTVMNDDPLLTVRNVQGRNPVRIIIDGNFSLPIERKVFTRTAPTILYISQQQSAIHRRKKIAFQKQGVKIVTLKGNNGKIKINHILDDLRKQNIASVLVEGGQKMYNEFFNARAVDKLYLFTATKKKYKQGLKTFSGIVSSYKKRNPIKTSFGTDILCESNIVFSKK